MKSRFIKKVIPFIFTFVFLTLVSNISFNDETNTFTISVNTTQRVQYFLWYKTNTKEKEVVTGKSQISSEEFSREIYAGTCSSGGTCVPHNVVRGGLKIKVPREHFKDTKLFKIIDGELILL